MKSLLVIAGPSAVGKTTVSDEILRQNTRFTLIRSATTRAPRGDGHDDEYIYFDETDFRREIARGGMLEYTEYSGNLYGTLRSEILLAQREGKIPLLILDLSGVASLRSSEYEKDTLFVYLYDKLDTLEERLYARYMTPPTEEGLTKFSKRKEQNIADYLAFRDKADMFDLIVSNATSPTDTANKIILAMSGTDAIVKDEVVASLYAMANARKDKV